MFYRECKDSLRVFMGFVEDVYSGLYLFKIAPKIL